MPCALQGITNCSSHAKNINEPSEKNGPIKIFRSYDTLFLKVLNHMIEKDMMCNWLQFQRRSIHNVSPPQKGFFYKIPHPSGSSD